MGKVESIWIKRVRRGPMDAVVQAHAVEGRGLEGNVHQGGWRQITLIEREAWDAMMAELGAELDPSTRRANVLVSGISLAESRGRVLRLGGVRLRIAGETKPCERMEAALPGLRETMHPAWRGGAFAQVLDTGSISVGDEVAWMPSENEAAAGPP